MAIILVGDIGGTKANLGLFDGKKVLFKEEYPTPKIHDFNRHVQLYLDDAKKQGFEPKEATIAVSGPVTYLHDRAKVRMSNAKLVISEEELEKETSLEEVTIINDFEAIGYATNDLARKERKILRVGRSVKGPRIVIGAGTGLGKALLIYDKKEQKYYPIRSELAQTDLPIHNEEELALANFIRELEKIRVVTYEDVLSGKGLERLYLYYSHKHLPAERIMDRKDAPTRDAIADFIKFYARAFRNEIVDDYATGGIYIAGGMAAAHPEIFKGAFLKELAKHDKKEYRDLLCEVPITIITDYDVSLKGAGLRWKK